MQHESLSSRYGAAFRPRSGAGAPPKDIHHAAEMGDVDRLEAFVAAGHQQDRETASGMTPLHVACEHGHLDCVKHLLQHKVHLDVRDTYNVTPLHLACIGNFRDIALALVKAGAPVASQDAAGDLPIHWAATRGHCEIIEMLLQCGSPLDPANNQGWTPLHRAAFNGRRLAMQTLLSSAASVTAVNHDGNTALHLACHANQLAVIEYLLSLGVDAAVANKHGESAYDVCITDTARDMLRPGEQAHKPQAHRVAEERLGAEAAQAAQANQPGAAAGALHAADKVQRPQGAGPASRGEASLLSDHARPSSKPGTPDLDWVAAHVANSSPGAKKMGPGPVLPPIGSSPVPGLDELQDEEGRQAVEAALERRRPVSANKKFLAKYGLHSKNLFAPA